MPKARGARNSSTGSWVPVVEDQMLEATVQFKRNSGPKALAQDWPQKLQTMEGRVKRNFEEAWGCPCYRSPAQEPSSPIARSPKLTLAEPCKQIVSKITTAQRSRPWRQTRASWLVKSCATKPGIPDLLQARQTLQSPHVQGCARTRTAQSLHHPAQMQGSQVRPIQAQELASSALCSYGAA